MAITRNPSKTSGSALLTWAGIGLAVAGAIIALMHVTMEFMSVPPAPGTDAFDVVTTGKGVYGPQLQYIPLLAVALACLLPVFSPLLRRLLSAVLALASSYCAWTILRWSGPADLVASFGSEKATQMVRYTSSRTWYLAGVISMAAGFLLVVVFPGVVRTRSTKGELDGWRVLDRGEDPTKA